jgi:hypothetical protein
MLPLGYAMKRSRGKSLKRPLFESRRRWSMSRGEYSYGSEIQPNLSAAMALADVPAPSRVVSYS